ncbi:hypothetical protein ACIBCA_21040 [Kitasatospora sp. NPDC051170]|uniref:hypothetical protein n=1 Tax=Kitasatospora sp. NPDC051170 TaxID=3364056 RepID=UPI00379F51AC
MASVKTRPAPEEGRDEARATTADRPRANNVFVLGRAQRAAPGTLVASCRGKDVYFTVDGGYDAPDVTWWFPDQRALRDQFVIAAGRMLGCEPFA